MNILSIQDNYGRLTLLSKEDRIILAQQLQGQDVQLDDLSPEVVENAAENILQKFINETNNDPEMTVQAFEFLTNLRNNGSFTAVASVHLKIAAQLMDAGL